MIAPVYAWIGRIGAASNDSDELRVKKSSLVLNSLLGIAAGASWGICYILLGQRLAGWIPLSYAIVVLLSIAIFHLTRQYNFFLFAQLLLILVLPFLLMVALGGFVKSSGVILWSLFSPLGALLFDRPRNVPRWWAAYLILIAASGFLEWHPLVSSSLSPLAVTIFFVLNIGVVSTIIIVLLAYFVGQKDQLFDLLRKERVKSENLLLNILPAEIAAVLKTETRTIAEHYEGASIMFADMVGFTPLSEQLAPVEMVELLNEAFSFFDSLLDKHGLEKIRTIGDSYMVASGLPHRRNDHAQALVSMALEMRDYLAAHTFRGSQRLSFRIGINSGSMIAGVIGRRKFVYDVWGDAVNVASRMESHGLSGAVQITRATYELIKNEFACEQRGVVDVKGKGEMDVWLVTCALDQLG